MILTFNDNPELKITTVLLAKFNAIEALERSLRAGFDNATSMAAAEGYIKAALELGSIDLANDMINDLEEIVSQRRISA